jgi:beta-aspartyl-dipeptidase (metallo-type)
MAADVHLGGVLSGKRGTVFVHVGDGESGLGLIEQVLQGSELPRWLFYPTHVNRNQALLEQAIGHAHKGGYADITVASTEEFVAAGEVPALQALGAAIEAGAPADHLTFSSDAGGSLPLYRDGRLVKLQSAEPGVLLELLNAARAQQPDLVPAVIAALTRNPAAALGLAGKGRVAAGLDADLLLFDPADGCLREVFCGGRRLMGSGDPR